MTDEVVVSSRTPTENVIPTFVHDDWHHMEHSMVFSSSISARELFKPVVTVSADGHLTVGGDVYEVWTPQLQNQARYEGFSFGIIFCVLLVLFLALVARLGRGPSTL